MSDLPERSRDQFDASGIRASDAEREDVVQQLSEHATSGRLTLAELDERIEQTYQAKTRAELVKLTSDLPDAAHSPTSPSPSGRPATRTMFAIMGGSDKKGRWRVGRHMRSIAVMGGHSIDLRNAELESDDTIIDVIAIMGGTEVFVPDGVDLDVGGFAFMGGNEERGSTRPARPGAPRIKLRLYSVMGGSSVWRLPEETKDLSLREARKVAKRLS